MPIRPKYSLGQTPRKPRFKWKTISVKYTDHMINANRNGTARLSVKFLFLMLNVDYRDDIEVIVSAFDIKKAQR